MKRKKLGFMNIKNEDVLTRDEMRSVLAGSGCSCESEDGCVIHIDQQEDRWAMSINCGTGPQYYSGWGTYGGSACGGQCP